MQQNKRFTRRAKLASFSLILVFTVSLTQQANASAWDDKEFEHQANGVPMLEEDVWMQSTANSSKASITEDACFNALNSNQPLLAVQEAQSLLKQKALPQKTAHLANLCLGRGWFAQGELNKALPPLLEAARLAGNTEERAAAFSSLGAVYGKQGKLDMAQAAYRKQLAAAEELGDASKQASALSNLGSIAYERRQYDEALRLDFRALTLQPVEQNKAVVLNNIANVHGFKGDYALAVDALQQAIAIDRKYASPDLGIDLLNLGNIYRKLKNWPENNRYLNEGLDLVKGKDRNWEAQAYRYFGMAFQDIGDKKQAREYFEAALKIFREIGANAMADSVARIMGTLK